MGDFGVGGKANGLGKINQPDAGLCLVVHKEEGAADDFVRLKEVGSVERGTNRFQTVNIFGLRNGRRMKLELVHKRNMAGICIFFKRKLTATCGNPYVKSLNAVSICSLDLVVLKSLELVPSPFLMPCKKIQNY